MNQLHMQEEIIQQHMHEQHQAAANHRLVQESRAHQPRLYRPLLAQLGRKLSHLGQHLQETYAQPEPRWNRAYNQK